MADFFKRTSELKKIVGQGALKGEFAADRIYAVNQHEANWLSYMGTGKFKEIRNQHQGHPKFVEGAWKQMWHDWMDDFADAALEGRLNSSMERAMKDFDDYLKERAPVRDGDLRRSGTYTVYDQGVPVAHKESETTYDKQGRE